MDTSKHILSSTRLRRIREQGFDKYSDGELTNLAFGIRFAYRVCAVLLTIGLIFPSTKLLYVDLGIAFFSFLLPNHPFDYVYNHFLANRMSLPKLPHRSIHLKFACTIAAFWLATVIYLMNSGQLTAAYVLGFLFLGVVVILSTTDFCMPSVLFNELMSIKNAIRNATQKSNR